METIGRFRGCRGGDDVPPGLTGLPVEGIVIPVHSGRGYGRGPILLKTRAHDGNLPGLGVVELDGAGHPQLAQGLLHGGKHRLEENLVFFELDFRLGGVDIHVHGGGVHVQIDEIGRRATLRHLVFIGLHHGLVQQGAAEVSAVDKEKLVSQGFAGALRLADIPLQRGNGGLGRYVHKLADKGGPQKVLDAEFMALGGLHHMDVLAVVGKGEGHVLPGEGHPLKLFHNVAELYVVAFEELAAGGNVVKEVPHRNVGSRGAGDFPGALVLGGRHGHFHAQLLGGHAGAEAYLRHGGDGGQGLSAEAEGKDAMQVFGRCQLGGGMPLEAQHGVVRAHAAAVVNYLNQGAAGIGHHHFHVRGAGVHRILHEFLHHGSRPLDHFSRGNHVRDILRQNLQFHIVFSRA